MRHLSQSFFLILVIISGLFIGLNPTFSAATGSISGRVYFDQEEGVGTPILVGVPHLVLVVPVSRGTTLDLTEFAPGARTDLVTNANRSGHGLVKADVDGNYSVTGLADGEYHVLIADPFVRNWKSDPPPVKVTFATTGPGTVATEHFGYRVTVAGGRTVTDIDFFLSGLKFEPLTGATTGSVLVKPETFDPKTLARIPDKILSATIAPLPAGTKQTRPSEGEALFENIPPGPYIFTVRTAAQGEFTIEIFVYPSTKTATIAQSVRPPRTGDAALSTPEAGRSAWALSGLALGAAGLLIAIGVKGLVARPRPGSQL